MHKKHKIIPRSCCLSAIMLLSPTTFLLISMVLNLNCFYKIFARKHNSHSHFKCRKKQKIISRSWFLSAIMLLSYYFMLNSINKDLQRKDGQRQLLCYVSLIRACNKVLYQMVHIFLKESVYLTNQ